MKRRTLIQRGLSSLSVAAGIVSARSNAAASGRSQANETRSGGASKQNRKRQASEHLDSGEMHTQKPPTEPIRTEPLGGQRDLLYLLYPGFTTLDFYGPHSALGLMGYRAHVVARDLEPVVSDSYVATVPTLTFDEMPTDPAVVLVPGGSIGTAIAARDPEFLRALKRVAAGARYVASVCTGSIILGAAGLLEGKRATSHWAARDHLKSFGAKPVPERYVIDGRIATSAGVSAGIDLGLRLTSILADEEYAKAVQLNMEYAPTPPFSAGTPESAPPKLVAMMQEHYGGLLNEFTKVGEAYRGARSPSTIGGKR